MKPTLPCPACHRPIPADAPDGICPTCALRGVMQTQPTLPSTAMPTLEEVAAAFPDLEISGIIGQGGMGVIFKARQPRLDRMVALKILLPHLAAQPGFAERFTREARALARLHHPSIVTVFDFGSSGGFYYLMMEYVDGVNLRKAMQAGIKPEQALLLVPRICEALQFAHDHGVLHRDIKPENILLDRSGAPRLADFGIAKFSGETATGLTLSGAALGTAAYMAPEQIEKPATVDHRADIYSLGVVLYEMLTGELPLGRFAAPSAKANIGEGVDAVVFRALEKERERRQQSAGEFKTQVEDARTGKRPPQPPPLPVVPPPLPAKPGPSKMSALQRLAFIMALIFAALFPLADTAFRGVGLRSSSILAGCLLFAALGVVLGLIGRQSPSRPGPVREAFSGCLRLVAIVAVVTFTTFLVWCSTHPGNITINTGMEAPRPIRVQITEHTGPQHSDWTVVRWNIRAWQPGIAAVEFDGREISTPLSAPQLLDGSFVATVHLSLKPADNGTCTEIVFTMPPPSANPVSYPNTQPRLQLKWRVPFAEAVAAFSTAQPSRPPRESFLNEWAEVATIASSAVRVGAFDFMPRKQSPFRRSVHAPADLRLMGSLVFTNLNGRNTDLSCELNQSASATQIAPPGQVYLPPGHHGQLRLSWYMYAGEPSPRTGEFLGIVEDDAAGTLFYQFKGCPPGGVLWSPVNAFPPGSEIAGGLGHSSPLLRASGPSGAEADELILRFTLRSQPREQPRQPAIRMERVVPPAPAPLPPGGYRLQGQPVFTTGRAKDCSAGTVHVGGTVVFAIVGKGFSSSTQTLAIGDTISGHLEMHDKNIEFRMVDANRAFIHGREYDLAAGGRLFIALENGTVVQRKMDPLPILTDENLDDFVKEIGLAPHE